MEKPFGHDYQSAVELNALLHTVFDESQIFRIDHFLGKESVQNVLALRFANGLFEPLWNRNNIEMVQIDVPETLDVGNRAGFYDETGAYRDMIVTHLLQLAQLHRDGAARRARRQAPAGGEAEGLRLDQADRARRRDPRPVRGLPRHRGRARGLRHGDVRRGQGRGRQLALGRRPLLPADRQVPARVAAPGRARLPRAADEHVPRRGPAPGRQPARLRVLRAGLDHRRLPGQGAGADARARARRG